MNIEISPFSLPSIATLGIPPSKSRMARAIVIAGLTGDLAFVEKLLQHPTSDIRHAAQGMYKLIHDDAPVHLHLGQSGTALRLLTAVASLISKEVYITGDAQLLRRPLIPLLNALRSMGAEIVCTDKEGFAPLHILPHPLRSTSEIDATTWGSSQYLSALLLIAPQLPGGLKIKYDGKMPSFKYVDLTLRMMMDAGAHFHQTSEMIEVEEGKYRETLTYNISGDWSSAAYWIALLALSPDLKELIIPNLVADPTQADSCIIDLMERLEVTYRPGEAVIRKSGAVSLPQKINLSGSPDLFPILSVCYCLLSIPVEISGLEQLRFKESPRLETMCKGLEKLGYGVKQIGEGTFHYDGRPPHSSIEEPVTIDSKDDHRITMAFSIASIFLPHPILITDRESVRKSFPTFFRSLEFLNLSHQKGLYIRKSQMEDLDRMEELYANARNFMHTHGNPNQWTGGYPTREQLVKDINKGGSYLCCDSATGNIEGVFYFVLEPEPTYAVIYEGRWLSDRPYGVIHRIASAGNRRRVAQYCFKWCGTLCESIRIDTYKDNQPMLRAIKKAGFVPCGTILLRDGSPRLAFQKDID